MWKPTSLLLLLATLNFALAQDDVKLTPVYFTDGGKLTLDLRPRATERLTNILWRLGGDLLAEWVENVVELSYYRTFKTRTTLDTKTGRLEINKMSKADTGVYSVEVNNKNQMERYEAVLVKEVSQPGIWVSPLACGHGSDTCTLKCEANTTETGPVTYSWRLDDGEWEESGENMTITKDKHVYVETFSCLLKGRFNEEASKPKVNPLFQTKPPDNNVVGKAVGGTVGVVLFALAVLGLLWILKKGPFKNRGVQNTDSENGRTTRRQKEDPPSSPSPPADNPDKPAEKMPLNSVSKEGE